MVERPAEQFLQFSEVCPAGLKRPSNASLLADPMTLSHPTNEAMSDKRLKEASKQGEREGLP